MAEDLEIRIATLEDLDEVMQLAMLATEENAFLPPDPELLLRAIYPALMRSQGVVGVIGKPDGMIEGVVVLRIGTLWYSASAAAEELAVFIHPDYRDAKGGRAGKLCDFSKKVADDLGLPLMIGVLSNARTAAKVKMYERKFGPPAGAYFLYNGHTGRAGQTKR